MSDPHYFSMVIPETINEALDLSARQRKMPEAYSPYESFSFGYNTIRIRDPPSTSTSVIHRNRHFSSSTASFYSPGDYSAMYPTDININNSHHSSSEGIESYLHCIKALRRQFSPHQQTPTKQSNESFENSSLTSPDRTLPHPFIPYQNTLLPSTSSISANDPNLQFSTASTSRCNIYEDAMLTGFCENNGCQNRCNDSEFRSDSVSSSSNFDPSSDVNKASEIKEESKKRKRRLASNAHRKKRKTQFQENSIRVAVLEKENAFLKAEIALANQLADVVYTRNQQNLLRCVKIV